VLASSASSSVGTFGSKKTASMALILCRHTLKVCEAFRKHSTETGPCPFYQLCARSPNRDAASRGMHVDTDAQEGSLTLSGLFVFEGFSRTGNSGRLTTVSQHILLTHTIPWKTGPVRSISLEIRHVSCSVMVLQLSLALCRTSALATVVVRPASPHPRAESESNMRTPRL
jgi:hypothetical protein